MALHNCGQCHYLERTSPAQVFLLCKFWSATPPPVRGVLSAVDMDYIVGHCHMQPEALACMFFKQKEVPMAELTDAQKARLSAYTSDVYAELARMTVKQLRTYAGQHKLILGNAHTKKELVTAIVGDLRTRKTRELAGVA